MAVQVAGVISWFILNNGKYHLPGNERARRRCGKIQAQEGGGGGARLVSALYDCGQSISWLHAPSCRNTHAPRKLAFWERHQVGVLLPVIYFFMCMEMFLYYYYQQQYFVSLLFCNLLVVFYLLLFLLETLSRIVGLIGQDYIRHSIR